eukprot:GHVO01021667.1.p1 GENE.GHVO01021667.1~~GHVO01021667.1.p1  ORF type:complete len:1058 (+),score=149.73 GHVO01021667.1:452-3175(+)
MWDISLHSRYWKIEIRDCPAPGRSDIKFLAAKQGGTEAPCASVNRALILDLVQTVPRIGVPGVVGIFGSQAFSVLSVDSGSGSPQSVCGASRYHNGRVIAYSHNGYCGSMIWQGNGDVNLARILRNSIIWAAKRSELITTCDNNKGCPIPSGRERDATLQCIGTTEKDRPTIRVAFIGHDERKATGIMGVAGLAEPGHAATEKQLGIVCIARTSSSLKNIHDIISEKPDVIVWSGSTVGEEIIEAVNPIQDSKLELCPKSRALINAVADGMGLVVGLCPWGWEQISGGRDVLEECIFNRTLCHFGLRLLPQYIPGQGNFDVPYSIQNGCKDQAGVAVRNVEKSLEDGTPASKIPASQQLLTIRCADIVPIDSLVWAVGNTVNENDICGHGMEMISNTFTRNRLPKFPLSLAKGNLPELLYVASITRLWPYLPLNVLSVLVNEHDKVPGMVHVGSTRLCDAPIALKLDGEMTGWQSTGMYAPPGEVITVCLPFRPECATEKMKIDVRIGCHTDSLKLADPKNPKYELKRWPKVSACRSWYPFGKIPQHEPTYESMSSPRYGRSSVSVASPFGGNIYIDVHNVKGGSNTGNVCIMNVSGASRSPWWSSDRNQNDTAIVCKQWKQDLESTRGVPWGELEGDLVCLHLPYSTLTYVQNPMELMRFWDEIVSGQLALANQTAKKKERIVFDVQITCGLMHSGYPIMANWQMTELQSDKAKTPLSVDIEYMKSDGSWGLWHELGHNRQKSAWTFKGTTEVTVNIFTAFSYQQAVQRSPYQLDNVKRYVLAKGVDYLTNDKMTFQNRWQTECWVGFSMYCYLIEEFGWNLISDTFRAYELMDSKELPKSDEDKINCWMVMSSRYSGKDLRPFYTQWKWPVDKLKQKDTEYLNSLPKWEGDVVRKFKTLIEKNSS